MNIPELAKKTEIPEETLRSATEKLGIKGDDLTRDDIVKIHTYLKNRPELKVSSSSLRTLGDVNPSSFSVDRKKVAFLGGSGFNPSFIVNRKNETIELLRKTRNCGDTAGLVLDGLKCQKIAMVVERDKTRNEFCAYLQSNAIEHEVWQVTVHQHTFTLERCSLGNWIVQSYQSTAGTYNVQFWCGLDDSFIDLAAKDTCGPMSDKWYNPSNSDLAALAVLINRLYDEGKESRKEIWMKLPFHPQDTGRVVEETDNLAFSAERIVLKAAKYAPCTVAGLEMVLFKK
jgi:predicted SpoU family rRNA methylase